MLQQESFQSRLRHCVQQVGTQKDFLEKTEISRSQLFRYLEGESLPTVDKVLKFAEASNTNISWLISGEGSPCKTDPSSLSFSYDLITTVIQLVEETLMEYTGPALTPAQKAMLMPMVHAEMELEKAVGLNENKFTKGHMHKIFDYIWSIKKSNLIDTYYEMSKRVLLNAKDLTQSEDVSVQVNNFISTAEQASIDYFSLPSSQAYYKRTEHGITEYNRHLLFKIMESVFCNIKSPKIKMLDVGCGSGKYMEYMHANYADRIEILGVEPSELAFEKCKQKEKQGGIPTGSVFRKDASHLPFEKNSIEFAFSRNVLHWIPYVKEANTGTNKVFAEVARVLKPGGAFYFDAREGTHREFLPFNQMYSKQDVYDLAKTHGFKVLWIHTEDEPYFNDLIENKEEYHSRFKNAIRAFLIKA